MTQPNDRPADGFGILDALCAAVAGAARADRLDPVVRVLDDPEAMAAIVEAYVENQIRCEASFVKLKKAGCTVDLLETLRSMVRRAAKDAQRADREERVHSARASVNEADDTPLGEIFGRADLPPLVCPPGWAVSYSGVSRRAVTEDGGETLVHESYRPIIISAVLRDVEGKSESLVLEWPDHAGPYSGEARRWRTAVCPQADVQDARAFLATRNLGAPVAGHNSRILGKFLDAFEATNARTLPTATLSPRMGFVGESFLWGRQQIRGDGAEVDPDAAPGTWPPDFARLDAVDGRAQIAAAYSSAGTMAGWVDAIVGALPFPSVMLGLYASLAAPFLHILPDPPNPILDWAGETSHGKTTCLRVAASAWGVPDERGRDGVTGAIVPWDATPAGIESMADMTQHLPMLLDDTKRATTAGRAEFVAQMIYQVSNGTGRVRGNTTGGMRKIAVWRCVMLTTGESPATSFTKDAGARARVICMPGSPFGEGDHSVEVEALRARLGENYGHAGPEVVRWLLRRRDLWPRICETYESAREKWANAMAGDPVGARAAHYLALLEAGAFATHDILSVPRPDVDPLALAARCVSAGVADTDQPAEALRSVYAWCAQHQPDFWGRHVEDGQGVPKTPAKGWAGAWKRDEWDRIAFSKDALARVLEYLGHDPTAILASWQERGWRQNDGRNLNPYVRVDGAKDRMVCVTREAFEAVMPGLGDAKPLFPG